MKIEDNKIVVNFDFEDIFSSIFLYCIKYRIIFIIASTVIFLSNFYFKNYIYLITGWIFLGTFWVLHYYWKLEKLRKAKEREDIIAERVARAEMFKNLNKLNNNLPPLGFKAGKVGNAGKSGSSGTSGTSGKYTNNGYVGPTVKSNQSYSVPERSYGIPHQIKENNQTSFNWGEL